MERVGCSRQALMPCQPGNVLEEARRPVQAQMMSGTVMETGIRAGRGQVHQTETLPLPEGLLEGNG